MSQHHSRFVRTRPQLWAVLVAVAFLSEGTPVYAQISYTALSPTTSCAPGQPPSSGAKGDGNDLQCRLGNILSKHQTVLTTLQNKLSPCTGPHCHLLQDHLDKATGAQQRALHAHGRIKSEDFTDLNTLRKTKCPGKDEDCANGKGGKAGGETDSAIGIDISDQLDAVATGLDTANSVLSEPPSPLASLRPRSPNAHPSSFEALYDYLTDPEYPSWLHTGNPDGPALTRATFAMLVLAQAATIASDVAHDACGQTAVALGFGGNTSAVCIAFSIAKDALSSTYTFLDFVQSDTTGWQVQGAYNRLQNLNNNLGVVGNSVANVQASVGNTQTMITNLQNQVTALQNQVTTLANALSSFQTQVNQQFTSSRAREGQILGLLLLPDGQRTIGAALLTCDGTAARPCPPVVVKCSTTTGQCSFSGSTK